MAEFCATLSEEFGCELDVEGLEEDGDEAILVDDIYNSIGAYAREWLMGLLHKSNPALKIGSDQMYQNQLVNTIARQLLAIKGGYAELATLSEGGKSTEIKIGDDETIEEISSRVEICLQQVQELILDSALTKDTPPRGD